MDIYSRAMNNHPDRIDRKRARQSLVLDVVRREAVATQEDLVAALRRRGVPATQASVSRDVAELGLVKVAGHYRAALAGDDGRGTGSFPLRPWLREATAVPPNLVVVLCDTGTAQKVALAIDQQRMPEVVGTLAGDDTVFVAVPSRAAGRRLERRLRAWIA